MIGQPEDPADLELIKADLKTFESKNAGITVKLDVIPSENVRTVLQTQLRSGRGRTSSATTPSPDSPALAKAGLVYDLTGAYEEYQWPIYDFAKQRVTFDGKIVGVPSQIEKARPLLQQGPVREARGGQSRRTCRTARRGREAARHRHRPDGGQRQGRLAGRAPAEHVAVQRRRVEAGMDDLLSGRGPGTAPSVVLALRSGRTVTTRSCCTSSPTAVSYDNANALFYSGKAAINPTGSWLALDIERNAKFEVGYIPFPSWTARASSAVVWAGHLRQRLHHQGRRGDQVPGLRHGGARPVGGGEAAGHPGISDRHERDRRRRPVQAGPGRHRPRSPRAPVTSGTTSTSSTNDAFNNAMWKGIQGILSGQATPEEVAKQLQAANYEKPTG